MKTLSDPIHEKLPFTSRLLEVQDGTVEEYIIPDDMKEEVLKLLFIFKPIPSLDEMFYDIHEEKKFCVRDFRVIWDGGHNCLVSPYFPSSGGLVIDWMPIAYADIQN